VCFAVNLFFEGNAKKNCYMKSRKGNFPNIVSKRSGFLVLSTVVVALVIVASLAVENSIISSIINPMMRPIKNRVEVSKNSQVLQTTQASKNAGLSSLASIGNLLNVREALAQPGGGSDADGAASHPEISGIPETSYPDYPAAGIEAGVWNDGQAALWDLAIIDHYKYVGAEERADGYRPEQPINFSHIVHVQKNKMECQYCHWNVNKSNYAAIPEVESCMGCHKLVKGGDEASRKEIAKLEDYYNRGEPIPWEKVHVMPNHYKFNHKRHVKAGVTCHQCHGQVGEMAVVERTSSMKMGWCIDCHREQGTSIDCATCHY